VLSEMNLHKRIRYITERSNSKGLEVATALGLKINEGLVCLPQGEVSPAVFLSNLHIIASNHEEEMNTIWENGCDEIL